MDAELSKERLAELLRGVGEAVRTAQGVELPVRGEFFYHDNFTSFSEFRKAQQGRIKAMLQRVPGISEQQAAALMDPEESEEAIGDTLTDLLMPVSASLERHKSGRSAKRGPETPAKSGEATIAKKPKTCLKGVFTPEGSSAIPKPQDTFETPVDNSNRPFIHRWCCADDADLPSPLPSVGTRGVSGVTSRLESHARGLRAIAVGAEQQQHPLMDALQSLTYNTWQLETPEPIAPGKLEDTPFTLVDTAEGLEKLAASLVGAREVAVDLEAHQYRSFMGFTCLMQISTREADWVVDTLALRSHVGPRLGRVFADPGVQKVLHGADYDIQWLQRDFGIYVVNMFDTGQAARVLELPSIGLAYLMDHYCGVKVDKRYQLADWRVRPIPSEMIHYARMDTHHLLYIHDRLKAELADKLSVPHELRVPLRTGSGAPSNALGVVLERSGRLCLKLFEKELLEETSYIHDLGKHKGDALSPHQTVVYAALYNWRDGAAREADESLGYVMSRAVMLEMAKRGPDTKLKVLAIRHLSPVAVAAADKLASVVIEAKKQAAADTSSTPTEETAAPPEPTGGEGGSIAVPGETRASPPAAPSSAARPIIRVQPSGGMAAALMGSRPATPGSEARPAAKVPAVEAVSLERPRGALAGILGAAARPKATTGQSSEIPPSPTVSVVKAVSLGRPQGGLAGILGAAAKGTQAARGGGEGGGGLPALRILMESAALRGTAAPAGKQGGGGEAQGRLRDLRGTFALPFSLVASDSGDRKDEEPEGQDVGTNDEAAPGGSDSPGGAVNEVDQETPGAKGQSVSEWLEQHRQEAKENNLRSRAAEESEDRAGERGNGAPSEEVQPQQYEDYLPMSLNETYKKPKRGQKGSVSNETHGYGKQAGGGAGGGHSAGPVKPYDYSGQANQNPGLASAFQPHRAGSKWREHNAAAAAGRGGARGRRGGARGRGRGGRDGAAKGGAGQKRGMHETDPSNNMMGGKRSSLFPRSGNRTSHFNG